MERKKLPDLGSNLWSSPSGSYPPTIRLLGTCPKGKVSQALFPGSGYLFAFWLEGMSLEGKTMSSIPDEAISFFPYEKISSGVCSHL